MKQAGRRRLNPSAAPQPWAGLPLFFTSKKPTFGEGGLESEDATIPDQRKYWGPAGAAQRRCRAETKEVAEEIHYEQLQLLWQRRRWITVDSRRSLPGTWMLVMLSKANVRIWVLLQHHHFFKCVITMRRRRSRAVGPSSAEEISHIRHLAGECC